MTRAAAEHLLTGLHAVSSRLRAQPDSVREVVIDADRRDKRMQQFSRLVRDAKVRLSVESRAALVQRYGDYPKQGVVAELRPEREPALTLAQLQPAAHDLLLVLDGVQDPHNLGACLRSADGAGVAAVIVPKDGSCGLTPVVRQTAAGAAETVALITVTNLDRSLASLAERGYWLYGADERADSEYTDADFRRPTVIVCGAEGRGMRRLTRERCDQLVRISLAGSVESLNVSVATAILLFEARRQRRPAITD